MIPVTIVKIRYMINCKPFAFRDFQDKTLIFYFMSCLHVRSLDHLKPLGLHKKSIQSYMRKFYIKKGLKKS